MTDANNKPSDDTSTVLQATEARQGRRGGHMMWVLGISMGIIVAIFAVMVVGVQGTRLSAPGGQTMVDKATLDQAKGFHAPPSQPRESENPQTTPTITPPAK
jgi:hypothetical protein